METKGEILLNNLMSNPKGFADEGKGYELLEAYFEGLPIDTLRPLLKSNDVYVQSTAVFIISELGKQACTLLDDVIPLLENDNPYMQSDILDSIMICAIGDSANKFVYILKALENLKPGIRAHAMYLTSNADSDQLQSSILAFENKLIYSSHIKGLSALCQGNQIDIRQVSEMIVSHDPIIRKYGAIAAKRLYQIAPQLLDLCVNSNDSDVSTFAKESLSV